MKSGLQSPNPTVTVNAGVHGLGFLSLLDMVHGVALKRYAIGKSVCMMGSNGYMPLCYKGSPKTTRHERDTELPVPGTSFVNDAISMSLNIQVVSAILDEHYGWPNQAAICTVIYRLRGPIKFSHLETK